MRPKPPAPKRPRLDVPDTTSPWDSAGDLPLLRPPLTGAPVLLREGVPLLDTTGSVMDANAHVGTSTMDIVDLPTVHTPQPDSGELASYLLKPAMLRGMQMANHEGLRYIVSRKFVDLEQGGTVHVEFDASIGAYRATDLLKKLPPGPALYKNYDAATWTTTRPPAIRARTALLEGAFKQLHPQATPEERRQLLRAYNLSPQQHVRLLQDLTANLQLPSWVQQHQRQSEDPANPQRFAQLQQEIAPLIRSIRDETYHWKTLDGFEESVTAGFLRGFLETLGYRRNVNGLLYRTDIPALFRVDDRTLFELSKDGEMLPRMKHADGSTTGTPMSATLSLAHNHLSNYGPDRSPPAEYLKYNYQTDTRPPRNPNKTYDDSASSDDDSSTSSQTSGSDDNSDMIRRKQQVNFVYVIDSRGMEVVLREENSVFNAKGGSKDSWLPDDDLEVHLSVPKDDGIPADRLWLLNSSRTKAANIKDIAAHAGDTGADIETRTHDGHRNKFEYDYLIESLDSAGKPILRISPDAFADDVVFPERIDSGTH